MKNVLLICIFHVQFIDLRNLIVQWKTYLLNIVQNFAFLFLYYICICNIFNTRKIDKHR